MNTPRKIVVVSALVALGFFLFMASADCMKGTGIPTIPKSTAFAAAHGKPVHTVVLSGPDTLLAVSGVVNIPASEFTESVKFVAINNSLGTAPYVGPIFRVDQNGVFLENVWAKVTMNGAAPTNLRIVKAVNYKDISPGAPYDTAFPFKVVVYTDLGYSLYTDSLGTPSPLPRYVVVILQ